MWQAHAARVLAHRFGRTVLAIYVFFYAVVAIYYAVELVRTPRAALANLSSWLAAAGGVASPPTLSRQQLLTGQTQSMPAAWMAAT